MDQIRHAIWTTFPGGGGGEARWQHQRGRTGNRQVPEKVGGRLLKRAATRGRKGVGRFSERGVPEETKPDKT